jgi:hypothetical protein
MVIIRVRFSLVFDQELGLDLGLEFNYKSYLNPDSKPIHNPIPVPNAFSISG